MVRAVAESQLTYGAGVWAPVGAEGQRRNCKRWGVTQGAEAKARVAYNTAVRVAVGVPKHTPLVGLYPELGMPEPGDVWAASVLRLWRRVALMPRGRLPREAWEHAWRKGKGNSFVDRLEAAHAALRGGAVPRSGQPGGTAEEARVAVRVAQRRRAEASWRTYVAEHSAAWWYAGVPVPGAAGGYRSRVPPGGCPGTGRRALVAHRLRGHFLGSGPMASADACPRCMQLYGEEAGEGAFMAPLEDEAHYWGGECPVLLPAHNAMVGALERAYPGFEGRFQAMPRGEKATALAFTVPDGRWGGGGDGAWAAGVRAVVQYGMDAAALCPSLGRAMWLMDR